MRYNNHRVFLRSPIKNKNSSHLQSIVERYPSQAAVFFLVHLEFLAQMHTIKKLDIMTLLKVIVINAFQNICKEEAISEEDKKFSLILNSI